MRGTSTRAWLALGVLALTPACHISGSFTSTETTLGTWTFAPTHCWASKLPYTLRLSSIADPLRRVVVTADDVLVSQERGAEPVPSGATPSILAPSGPSFTLTIQDLSAGTGAPLKVSSRQCDTFRFGLYTVASTTNGDVPVSTDYGGSLELDCPYPDTMHRFQGKFSFVCAGDY